MACEILVLVSVLVPVPVPAAPGVVEVVEKLAGPIKVLVRYPLVVPFLHV
jgi:hypothetical protein